MIELRSFFLDNIKESEYHYRFMDQIRGLEYTEEIFGELEEHKFSYEVFDGEEAISEFKRLCQPDLSFEDDNNICKFYLITYYLSKMGYINKRISEDS